MSNRNYIFRVIAGAYLGYLGFSLIKDVVQGAEGTQPMFMFAGVAFLVIAVALLVTVAISYKKDRANPPQADENEEKTLLDSQSDNNDQDTNNEDTNNEKEDKV
ncbi:MAG: hypothetical protein ACK5LL_12750 [Suipraeoptans sp.]